MDEFSREQENTVELVSKVCRADDWLLFKTLTEDLDPFQLKLRDKSVLEALITAMWAVFVYAIDFVWVCGAIVSRSGCSLTTLQALWFCD